MSDVEEKNRTGRTWADLTIEAILFARTWHVSVIILFAIGVVFIFGLYLYIVNFRNSVDSDYYLSTLRAEKILELQYELKSSTETVSALKQQLASVREKFTEVEIELNSAKSQRDAQTRRIQEMDKELAAERSKVAEAVASAVAVEKTRLDEIERSNARKISEMESLLKGSEDVVAGLKRQLSSASAESLQVMAELSSTRAERDSFASRIHEMSAEITAANDKLLEATADADAVDARRLKELEASKSKIETERNQLRERLSVEEEALSNTKLALTSALRREKTQNEAQERQASQLRLTIRNRDERIKGFQSDIQELQQAHAALRSEIDGARRELATVAEQRQLAQSRADSLETSLRTMRENADVSQPQNTTRAIWGATAIAYDGSFYGVANQTSKRVAIDNSLLICKGASNKKCVSKVSYQNSCFSIARKNGEGARPNNWVFNVSPTWQEAEQKALDACAAEYNTMCTIRFTTCSPAELEKPDVGSILFPE